MIVSVYTCWNDMKICRLSRTRTDVISYHDRCSTAKLSVLVVDSIPGFIISLSCGVSTQVRVNPSNKLTCQLKRPQSYSPHVQVPLDNSRHLLSTFDRFEESACGVAGGSYGCICLQSYDAQRLQGASSSACGNTVLAHEDHFSMVFKLQEPQ